ncbi:MAG: DegT/DnrJ/EryC1/StrS family aminotransferase [Phycisphaerae bacterium]
MKQIPLARPNITQAEIDAVVAVMQTPQLSLGPKVPEFEQAMADYCRTAHAVACSSGTAALHLLVHALGIGHGDEVITTPYSFVASANCVLFEHAKVVFADIDAESWNIDPQKVSAAVTDKTKAIIPVDVFGQIADLDPILALAREKDIAVIEDSCEALGGRYKGRPAGSIGDAGVFGFYPNKQLTTGEGGMIVTDDARLAELTRSLRNQGRDTEGGWLAHARLGYNYRLSDINCAIGIVQLQRMDDILGQRRRVADLYRQRLGDEGRIGLQRLSDDVDMSWFVFVVRLSDDYRADARDKILVNLRERGIGCSNYFAPIHLQPFFVEKDGYKPGDFPVTEALAARTIALPFHHELTESDVDQVCSELQKLL